MTGAEIAVAAVAISAGAAIGSTAYSASQQAEAADYNAKVAKRQASWEQMRAKAEADRLAERDKRLLASQRAHIAAGGLDPADASPLRLLTETAAQSNVDYRNLLLGGEMKANNLRSQADMYRAQGRNAIVGAGFQAASQLAGAASQYGMYQTRQNALTDSYTNGRGQAAPSNTDWYGVY